MAAAIHTEFWVHTTRGQPKNQGYWHWPQDSAPVQTQKREKLGLLSRGALYLPHNRKDTLPNIGSNPQLQGRHTPEGFPVVYVPVVSRFSSVFTQECRPYVPHKKCCQFSKKMPSKGQVLSCFWIYFGKSLGRGVQIGESLEIGECIQIGELPYCNILPYCPHTSDLIQWARGNVGRIFASDFLSISSTYTYVQPINLYVLAHTTLTPFFFTFFELRLPQLDFFLCQGLV